MYTKDKLQHYLRVVTVSLDLDKTLVHPIEFNAMLQALESVSLHITGMLATLSSFHAAEACLIPLSCFTDVTEISELGRLLVVLRDKLVECTPR
jgi:hypothetical protein